MSMSCFDCHDYMDGYNCGKKEERENIKKELDKIEDVRKHTTMLEDRYHLIIKRSRYNVNRRFDDTSEEILVDAYDISLVCAYNIIKLYGNCVELKRLEGEDGKTI